MLKLITFLTVSILLSSCSMSCSQEDSVEGKTNNKGKNITQYGDFSFGWYRIEHITVDNCQYIIAHKSNAISIIHKPNCSNTHKVP